MQGPLVITMLADGCIMFENVKIINRNFAGDEGMYNPKGARNFCILIDEPDASAMAADGWNVKSMKSRDEGGDLQPILAVHIGYKAFPPTICMVTDEGRKRTSLGEEELSVLDWVDIKTADLVIRPYWWEMKDGKRGLKAMVKSLFIHINEDPLQKKYADLEELPARSGRVEE